jgi:hypothetical protein
VVSGSSSLVAACSLFFALIFALLK